jgi:hypothetical protein
MFNKVIVENHLSDSDFFHTQPSEGGNILLAPQSAQPFHCGLNQVVGIVGTLTFGENILHPGSFEHRPNRTARNHASSLGSRLEHYFAGFEFAVNIVRNGNVCQSHLLHVLAGAFHAFADSFRHLIGFAKSVPHSAFAVTDHDNGTEAEAAATFYHFGHPVDIDYFFYQLFLLVAAFFGTLEISQETPPIN